MLRVVDEEEELPELLLLEELPEGGSVAIYRSDKGEKSFAEALSEKFSVRDIRAYTAAPGEYAASREELESADAFTFTSAAGARAALRILEGRLY